MTDDWENDPAWQRFVHNVREDALKKIDESAFVISLVPKAENVDIKFAVELGLGIMLDKPLLLVALPGTPIPERLRRVADEIVYTDVDTERGRTQLREAMKRLGLGL